MDNVVRFTQAPNISLTCAFSAPMHQTCARFPTHPGKPLEFYWGAPGREVTGKTRKIEKIREKSLKF